MGCCELFKVSSRYTQGLKLRPLKRISGSRISKRSSRIKGSASQGAGKAPTGIALKIPEEVHESDDLLDSDFEEF